MLRLLLKEKTTEDTEIKSNVRISVVYWENMESVFQVSNLVHSKHSVHPDEYTCFHVFHFP